MAANNQPVEMLVKTGMVTSISMEQALARQKASGQRLGEVLFGMGLITEEQWITSLSKEFGYKTISNITAYTFKPEVLLLVPGEFAAQRTVFPLKQKDGMLAIAVSDPFDSDTLEYLAQKTGLKTIPFLASRADIAAAVKASYGIEASAPVKKQKILVVDDSLSIAAIIQGALQNEGYQVFVGHDGFEGLKLALEESPDLIITDTVMPRMDGFGLLRALKGNPATAQIPMILVTAKSGCEDEERALASGFMDFISKPVQPVRLVSRVKRALELVQSIHRA
jgi:CheY-like chemotaxis protein